jgi:hypothetical protein
MKPETMNATAELRWPFAVRTLTPKLGAEIRGVDVGEGLTRNRGPTS